MDRHKRSDLIHGARDSQVTLRALTKRDWPIIEELFGSNGACGGCWCMWWRVERGGKLWAEAKGTKNRANFRTLVENGKVHGILAFSGEKPVGWCAFGPRSSFPRTESVRALKRDWSEQTWSINCFYIKREWRGLGVATRLADDATRRAFQLGARESEGYPVVPADAQKSIPDVFAWTGVPAIFNANGYREIPQQAGRRRIFVSMSANAGRKSDTDQQNKSATATRTKGQ